MVIIVEQRVKNCFVQIGDEGGILKNCNAITLANTLFNKPFGKKYGSEQMINWGLKKKNDTR